VAPAISVVIPTYRRETRLAFTLDALAVQTLPRDRFEVIVVRDSSDGSLTLPPQGLEVRFLTMPGPGPAMRRNHGWRNARAPIVAFTDDDCRPAPDWLERLLAAHRGDDAVLEGRTEPDPDEVHLLHGSARSMEVIRGDRWYPTCNLAYSRALLERLGGFDEELAFFGEDTDLGLRAERAGARLVYVDEAVVWHAVHVRSPRQALRDAAQRHAESAVIARHPEHRDELYLGAFVGEAHARWVLAALGVLVWRRSRLLAALAAYPYVVHRLGKRYVQPGFLTPFGVARAAADVLEGALVDGIEIALRARSSLRNRSLVL
jgi:GT2 family glycosyltransferase